MSAGQIIERRHRIIALSEDKLIVGRATTCQSFSVAAGPPIQWVSPKGSHHEAKDVEDGPGQKQVSWAVTVKYLAPNRALVAC